MAQETCKIFWAYYNALSIPQKAPSTDEGPSAEEVERQRQAVRDAEEAALTVARDLAMARQMFPSFFPANYAQGLQALRR